MVIVVGVSLIAFLLTFLESRNIIKYGMTIGFILVSFLGCVHYDYGNDYMTYYDIYLNIVSRKFDLMEIFRGNVYKEPGWALLCYFFEPFGGFMMMVAVLFVAQNVIMYNVIKIEVPKRWWALSVFVYLTNTSLYLLSFSMMRQSLVIFIFLGCWSLIKRRKILPVILILIFCTLIHKSSVCLIPFAFWGYVPIKRGHIYSLLFVLVFIMIWLSKDFMNSFLDIILENDELFDYQVYSKDSDRVTFGMGYAVGLIPFVLSLMYINSARSEVTLDDKKLVAMSMISFLITPFSSVIPLISRVSMYFCTYEALSLSRIYGNIKNRTFRLGLLMLYVFILVWKYIIFFQSPVFGPYYKTFKTIFS